MRGRLKWERFVFGLVLAMLAAAAGYGLDWRRQPASLAALGSAAPGDQAAWLKRALADQPGDERPRLARAAQDGELDVTLWRDPNLAGGKPVVAVALSRPPDTAWVGVYGAADGGPPTPDAARLLGSLGDLSGVQSLQRVAATGQGAELEVRDRYDERLGAGIVMDEILLLKWEPGAQRFVQVWRAPLGSEQIRLDSPAKDRLTITAQVQLGAGRIAVARTYALARLERGRYVTTERAQRTENYVWDPGGYRFVGPAQELPPQIEKQLR